MAGLGRPDLPVGEVLEGLRIGRPALVPLVGSFPLAPAMDQPVGDAGVDRIPVTERGGGLSPRLVLLPQHTRKAMLLLAKTAVCCSGHAGPLWPRHFSASHSSRRHGILTANSLFNGD